MLDLPDSEYFQHSPPTQEIVGIKFECNINEGSVSMQPFMKQTCPEIIFRRAVLDKRPRKINEGLFANPIVSDPHASLTFTDTGRIYIQDLGSKNGTFVLSGATHHKLIKGIRRMVVDGDIIFLGNPFLDDTEAPDEAVQLKAHFLKKSKQLIHASPGRYAAPVDFDSDTETELGDGDNASPSSSAMTSPPDRLLSPLPIRARNLSSPSRISSLFEFPTIIERDTVDDLSHGRRPNKKPVRKIKVSEVMGRLEDIRTNLLSLRDSPRFETCGTEKIEQKLEGLQVVVTGFQAQQEKIAQDQQEQLGLIKALQAQLSLKEPIEVDVVSKRKLDTICQDSDECLRLELNEVENPPTSHRIKKRRPKRKSSLSGAASTVGTLGIGAAMMWWGLSSF